MTSLILPSSVVRAPAKPSPDASLQPETDDTEFGAALLAAMLNATHGRAPSNGVDDQLPSISSMKGTHIAGGQIITSASLNSAFDRLRSIGPIAAAKEIMTAADVADGLQLSDVEQLFGFDNSNDKQRFARDTIAQDWQGLTDSGDKLDTSQLAAAIQHFMDAAQAPSTDGDESAVP